MKKLVLFFFMGLSFLSSAYAQQRAVVISPVADLLGQPHQHAPKKGLTLDQYYHNIPFSGNGNTCWRLHQVLFNEAVDVLEERGEEVKVKISNFYYIKQNESALQDTYWIAKKHLLFLGDDINAQFRADHFPPPISYHTKKLVHNRESNVVTLKKPFKDPVTKQTYSVGTRFLAHAGQDFSGSYDKGVFTVYIYDKKYHELKTTKIPKRYCIRNYFTKKEEQVKNYVHLLRSWTLHKRGFIPYVLGGFSWTINCEDDQYVSLKDPENQNPYFHRTNWKHDSKVGFDCVGIVARAAQICDIPFFFKNTSTLKKGLRPLRRHEKMIEGDLIYYPGHVMVISNLEKNLIIEARGYDHGYGKVQECHISDVFQEVSSLKELCQHFHEKKTLSVLDSDGKPFMKCKSYKILKILSAWD